MNVHPQPITDRARKILAVGLAGLLTTSGAYGQSVDADAFRRLQEENAALRRQVAELGGQTPPAATAPAARTPAAPATAPASRAAAPTRDVVTTETRDDGTVVLSPFEVNSERDYGYLKTNAATATRIGMEIQDVPMHISVISSEFLQDTNARSLVDLFRYTAAASGDTRFRMRIPANEATPQGQFTMRGFQVNNLMRNGVFSYISHNFDNVERVELVKGPASVFFGQGYPGGVINFITKRASFSDIPTTLTHHYDNWGGNRVVVDHNQQLSDKAAFRFVGSWEDTDGDRRFEYNRGFMVNPSVAFNPLKSGILKINLEMEYSEYKYNENDYDWIYSDFDGWRAAAANGPFLSTTIAANAGNGLLANVVETTKTPTLAYATYINNQRTATGNLFLPAYTSVQRGAYWTNAAGQRVYDENFNYTSRGAYSHEQTSVATATVDLTPTDWFQARYVFTRDNADHNSVGQGAALTTPYADGIHWNMGTGNRSAYLRDTTVHNLDLVFSLDFAGIKNKILVGGQRSEWHQQYLGNAAITDVNWAFLPGATNVLSNPDYRGTNTAKYAFGGVPVNQLIYQRDGSIKPVRQIFSNYDPGAEIAPDINKFFQDDRNALDGYSPKLTGYYVNYQGEFFKERLTVLAGFRRENRVEKYQTQDNNAPWFIYPRDEYMWENPAKYPENVWGHSINYQKTIPLDQTGDSWMAGASFKITEALSAYASVSKIFKFNSGNIGGYFPGDELLLAQGLLAQYSSIGQNGFQYRGQNVTSVSQFQSVLAGLRYGEDIPNEDGMNYEVGLKYSSPGDKIVGTVALFSANRANRKEDDAVAQSNLNETLNFSTDPNIIEGVRRAIALGATYSNPGANSGRLFRVRAYDNDVEVQGLDAEVIWTPVRNFQAVFNASFLPKAETIEDSRPALAKPGTPAHDLLSAAQKRDAIIYWGSRVENVPEYKFTAHGKYTFTQGLWNEFGRGAYATLGARYSSETVISRSVDWNPLAGGYQAGDFLVFDLTFGLPWEVAGYKVRTSLGIYNVTDEKYSEGSYVMSPERSFLLTNTLTF